MRGFMWVTRPVIVGLNRLANACLRRVGVEPVDHVGTGQGPDALRHLVEHSATVGTLDERYHGHLASALELQALTVGDMVRPNARPSSVPPAATAAQIQETAKRTGHLRLLVRGNGHVDGVVHVRDSLHVAPGVTAAELMRLALTLDVSVPVYEALGMMRQRRSHLCTVTRDGQILGLITLDDVLERLLQSGEPAA
jgi:CBS domain containing-hemolysin-like protein